MGLDLDPHVSRGRSTIIFSDTRRCSRDLQLDDDSHSSRRESQTELRFIVRSARSPETSRSTRRLTPHTRPTRTFSPWDTQREGPPTSRRLLSSPESQPRPWSHSRRHMLVVAKLEILNVFFVGMARAVVKNSNYVCPPRRGGTPSRASTPDLMILIAPSTRLLASFSGFFAGLSWTGDGSRRASRSASIATTTSSSSLSATTAAAAARDVPAPLAPQRRPRLHCPSRHASRNNNQPISSSISSLTHDRRHTCSRCGKSYKNAYILKRHMLYECGKAPSFSCPHCSFSSKYERNLKAHINHRHLGQSTMPSIVVNQRETRHQQGREWLVMVMVGIF